mmetsp:Transcript_14376/g.41931  ORF Transcript_14376/g.41931 Transcript_14376/m.41931 type:complete len:143 (-) Transcript_14376:55-483(-)
MARCCCCRGSLLLLRQACCCCCGRPAAAMRAVLRAKLRGATILWHDCVVNTMARLRGVLWQDWRCAQGYVLCYGTPVAVHARARLLPHNGCPACMPVPVPVKGACPSPTLVAALFATNLSMASGGAPTPPRRIAEENGKVRV